MSKYKLYIPVGYGIEVLMATYENKGNAYITAAHYVDANIYPCVIVRPTNRFEPPFTLGIMPKEQYQ